MQKYFKKLSKDHTELQKSFQDRADGSLEESTQTCDAYETLEIKETKLYLENETITKEKSSLLKNFQELENKLKALKKDLEELDELHDHQNEERCDFWRECAQAHKDYEDLEKSKHDIWVECENHKKSLKFSNEKFLKNEALEGQPQDVGKLH